MASRRQGGPDVAKARKDRAQAAFLVRALVEDRPEALAEAYRTALDQGPRWRARIGSSLDIMRETRVLLDAL